jgi:chromate reductase
MELKSKIRRADAILFATPEYNYSVPGVLKNAIDWASRPYTDNVWYGKPCAIMGASNGMIGTARAQYHLRQICVYLNMFPINKPEVFITYADQKFSGGELRDSASLKKLEELLASLCKWTAALNKSSQI